MAGDVCGSCGVEVLDGAQYCHSCGWRLDSAPIDFDVYRDENRGRRSDIPEPAQPSKRSLLIGVSAVVLVVVAGLLVFDWFAASDSPSAEPVPSTTVALNNAEPTTSVSDSPGVDASGLVLDSGSSLAWHDGPDLGGLIPVGIVEYDDQVFVFAAPQNRSLHVVGAGVDLWRSGDGPTWKQAGTVIESPNLVMSVGSDSDGLVAVGSNAEGDPAIWRSVDGSNWAMTTLPGTPLSSAAPVPIMSASAAGVEVIVGQPIFQNPFAEILPAMEKLAGMSLDGFGYGIKPDGRSLAVTISGPFNLPLLTASAEELGLSQDDVHRIQNGGIPTAAVWSRSDGADWHVTTLDQIGPTGLVVDNDGRFVIPGYGQQGPVTLRSDLGESWQQLDTGQNWADSTVSWKQLLLGIQGLGRGDILTSADGSDWKPIGLPRILPAGLQFITGPFAAGDQGIAATVHATSPEIDFATAFPEVILVKDGYTLTANDGTANNLVLRQGPDTLITKHPSSSSQAGIMADLSNQTVTFVDPKTADPYVAFTIDELRQLETAANKGLKNAGPQTQILFSTDAITWTVNDIAGTAGANRNVTGLQVTSHGLIAATTTEPATPTDPPATQIFIADYPS